MWVSNRYSDFRTRKIEQEGDEENRGKEVLFFISRIECGFVQPLMNGLAPLIGVLLRSESNRRSSLRCDAPAYLLATILVELMLIRSSILLAHRARLPCSRYVEA